MNTLNEALQARKNELSNIIEIITHFAGFSLSNKLTADQHRTILKDKIDALIATQDTNALTLNNVTNAVLTNINAMLGTNYTVADVQEGNVAVSALKDSVASSLYNKKTIIYRSITETPIGDVATSPIGVIPFLPNADITDWALDINGGHGCPYDTNHPVPVSQSYTDKTRVNVVTNNSLFVYNELGFRVVGYISDYIGSDAIVTWGYLNQNDAFIPANFPAILYPGHSFSLAIPIKSNLGILPLSVFASASNGTFASNSFASLDTIKDALVENGIIENSRLSDVIGLPVLTTAQFASTTIHSLLNPSGYSNISEAIADILIKLQQTRDMLQSHKDGTVNVHPAEMIVFNPTGTLLSLNVQDALEAIDDKATRLQNTSAAHSDTFDRIDNFLGKVNAQNIPSFTLFGDDRDKISQGDSVVAAINSINKAFYLNNIIYVAKTGGNFTSINSAIQSIFTHKFGIPSANNPFVVQIAPGTYNDSFTLSSHIHLVGSGTNTTIINGNAIILTNVTASIADLSMLSPTTVLDISSGKTIELNNVRLVNTATGNALKISNSTILNAHNVYFESVAGNAVDINASFVECNHGHIRGVQVGQIYSGGHLYLNCGATAFGPIGVRIINGKLTVGPTCQLSCSATAIECGSGEMRLLSGEIDGDVTADQNSQVLIGGAIIHGTLNVSAAITNAGICGQGIRVADRSGHFSSKTMEDIVSEIGFNLKQYSSNVIALNRRANQVEEDAITENATLILDLLPQNFSLVMVDSFRQNSNEHIGIDAALIDTETSVLRHNGSGIATCVYEQTLVGNGTAKTAIILRKSINVAPPHSTANNDYEISFLLEISGGRYTFAPLVYVVQRINASNIAAEAKTFSSLNLETMASQSGIKLSPIIQANETVKIKILIKKDSGAIEATPTIRSFAMFI